MVFSTKNTPKQRLWQSSRGEKRRGKKKKKKSKRRVAQHGHTSPYVVIINTS